MSDDQTYRSLRLMPAVQELLVDEGRSYRRFFLNFPACCPSRGTFLTGQYFHNSGVFGNVTRLDDTETLPVWLQAAGYRTGFVGKYLNGYGVETRPEYLPPGWDEWQAATGESTQAVFEYVMNENGDLVEYGDAIEDFKGDLLTRRALEFIRAGGSEPFFLYLAYTAPHHAAGARPHPPHDCRDSAQPAPRHAGADDGRPLPRPPSFDEAEIADKPAPVGELRRLKPADVDFVRERYRCALAALRSVDEGVADVVAALENTGALDDTLIIYTSDNGFFFGEHRIRSNKHHPYEEAIRAPLVIRGPGVGRGQSSGRLAVNPDLTRTVLDAAGAKPGLPADGISLLRRGPDRKAISIETTRYEGVRTRRYKYVVHDNGAGRELYDLRRDPFELENVLGAPGYAGVTARMRRLLERVSRCAGAGCR